MSGIPQQLPETGLLNLFVQHTSCALTINENADSDNCLTLTFSDSV